MLVKSFSRHTSGVRILFFLQNKNALWTFFVLWRRVRDFHSFSRMEYFDGSDPRGFYDNQKDASLASSCLWRRVRDFHSSLRDPPPCGSAPAPPWTRVCSSIHRTLPLTTRPFRVRIPEDFYYKRKDVSRTSFRLWRRVRDSNPGSG